MKRDEIKVRARNVGLSTMKYQQTDEIGLHIKRDETFSNEKLIKEEYYGVD